MPPLRLIVVARRIRGFSAESAAPRPWRAAPARRHRRRRLRGRARRRHSPRRRRPHPASGTPPRPRPRRRPAANRYGAAGDAARQRPDRIERLGKREHAALGNARRGRLEADDAADRRRAPARTAGVAAERAGTMPSATRPRRRKSSRRARGRFRVPRARGLGKWRVEAEAGIGEFGHVVLADDDEPGAAHKFHRVGVLARRRLAVARPRAGAGDLAGDVVEVLDRSGTPAKGGSGKPCRRASSTRSA